jgi:hypothetical protein
MIFVPRIRTHRRLVVGLAVVGAVLVAAASPAQSRIAHVLGSSLPTTPPIDAKAIRMTFLEKTFVPHPTSTKRNDGYQAITVSPQPGRHIVQGFATIAGGNATSVEIRSTQVVGESFVIHLLFPGEQGTPGTLHVLLQLIPRQ